jgi:glycosyltransferase involved in cell wall biosynthesis
MKICYLADAGSIHTQRWIKYFVDKGHTVHLISKRPFDCNHMDGVTLHLLKRLPDSPKFSSINLLLTLPQTKRLLRKIAPDVLHSHYVTDYGTFGALSGFRPLVVSAWGSDVLLDPKRSKIIRILINKVLQEADLITCDGENSKLAMIDLGIDSKKIILISHGVDIVRFNPSLRDGGLRRKLGVLDEPLVISTRKLEPIYDVQSLLKSIPLVLKDFPDARFVIAGEGSQRENLALLAESLGVSNHITFTGNIAHEELPKYLASSDVYISTSLSDGGMAVSTLEAMASGLATVVTDAGDANRWIIDGENGFIVKAKSPELLAKRIIYLLQNREILEKFGSINRRLIEESADYYKEMEKVERLYEKLVEEHSK